MSAVLWGSRKESQLVLDVLFFGVEKIKIYSYSRTVGSSKLIYADLHKTSGRRNVQLYDRSLTLHRFE